MMKIKVTKEVNYEVTLDISQLVDSNPNFLESYGSVVTEMDTWEEFAEFLVSCPDLNNIEFIGRVGQNGIVPYPGQEGLNNSIDVTVLNTDIYTTETEEV